MLEATKGVLVLLAAFGFAEIIHRNIDLEDAAQNLLYILHVDPDRRHVARPDACCRTHDGCQPAHRAGDCLLYSSLRFIESYGLWRQRVWAEWLAIISGAIYLPLRTLQPDTAAHDGALGDLADQYLRGRLHRVGTVGRGQGSAPPARSCRASWHTESSGSEPRIPHGDRVHPSRASSGRLATARALRSRPSPAECRARTCLAATALR